MNVRPSIDEDNSASRSTRTGGSFDFGSTGAALGEGVAEVAARRVKRAERVGGCSEVEVRTVRGPER